MATPLLEACRQGNMELVDLLAAGPAGFSSESLGFLCFFCMFECSTFEKASKLLSKTISSELFFARNITIQKISGRLCYADMEVDLFTFWIHGFDIYPNSNWPLFLPRKRTNCTLARLANPANSPPGNFWNPSNHRGLFLPLSLFCWPSKVSSGASVNHLDLHGVGPLLEAVRLGHLDLVRSLLAAGAVVNCLGCQGDTALHVAAELGHADVVTWSSFSMNTFIPRKGRLGSGFIFLITWAGGRKVMELSPSVGNLLPFFVVGSLQKRQHPKRLTFVWERKRRD